MQAKILAVIIAGIAGTLANAMAGGLVLDWNKFALALVPGRYAVAILCAGLLPFIYQRASGVLSHILALALLTLAPSLMAKLVFAAGAPWMIVLALNAVYALAAWLTYGWLENMPSLRRNLFTL